MKNYDNFKGNIILTYSQDDNNIQCVDNNEISHTWPITDPFGKFIYNIYFITNNTKNNKKVPDEEKNNLHIDFSKAVKIDKQYNLISSDLWINFKEACFDPRLNLILFYDNNNIWVKKYKKNTEVFDILYVGTINDKALGEYLWDRYFKEEDKESMITNKFINYNYDDNDWKYCHAEGSISNCDVTYDINSTNDSVIEIAIKATADVYEERIKKLKKEFDEYLNKEEKEEKKMKMFNFDFGPVKGDVIRMSMYGLAIKNASGEWVAYDKEGHAIMSAELMNFDGSKFFYKMPVALSEVKRGDVIIHAKKPMFVTKVETNTIFAVDPVDGENKEIMPTKSPFGFNFITRVVNLLSGAFENAASQDNPFGSMWPLLMSDDKMEDMLPMMLMMDGGNVDMNKMLPFLLMSGDKKDNLWPLMFLMNQKPQA